MPPRERSHRLPPESYQGVGSVAFTACLTDRKPLLAEEATHKALRRCLATATERCRCIVPIYCLMPDHMHILVTGLEEESDSRKAMIEFKRLSGQWFRLHRPEVRWQKDFYDEITRLRLGWQGQARYIAANPVRKGLAENVHDWPFTGSIGVDLDEAISEAFWT
ncbi:hypothetical protein EON81_18705 [bacterium]|nr:MAG: hypothetical protein EON81_18705 [bacterium]